MHSILLSGERKDPLLVLGTICIPWVNQFSYKGKTIIIHKDNLPL